MAYSNPTMDALSRGGSVANQGMSVANSMMQGVQRAMNSTSDLVFKLDTMLKNEQARKFQEGMAITQSLQKQYQFDVNRKLAEDRLKAQEDYRAADLGLRGAELNRRLLKDQKEYEKTEQENKLLQGLLGGNNKTQGITPPTQPVSQSTVPSGIEPTYMNEIVYGLQNAKENIGKLPIDRKKGFTQQDYEQALQEVTTGKFTPEVVQDLTTPITSSPGVDKGNQLATLGVIADSDRLYKIGNLMSKVSEADLKKTNTQRANTAKTNLTNAFNKIANLPNKLINIKPISNEVQDKYGIPPMPANVRDYRALQAKKDMLMKYANVPGVEKEYKSAIDRIDEEMKKVKPSEAQINNIQNSIAKTMRNRMIAGDLQPNQEAIGTAIDNYANILYNWGLNDEDIKSKTKDLKDMMKSNIEELSKNETLARNLKTAEGQDSPWNKKDVEANRRLIEIARVLPETQQVIAPLFGADSTGKIDFNNVDLNNLSYQLADWGGIDNLEFEAKQIFDSLSKNKNTSEIIKNKWNEFMKKDERDWLGIKRTKDDPDDVFDFMEWILQEGGMTAEEFDSMLSPLSKKKKK